MIHNAAYDALFLPNKIGILEKEFKRASHTDIGRTIFHEDEWYIVGPTVALQYSMNRTSVIIDFTIYLRTRDGE